MTLPDDLGERLQREYSNVLWLLWIQFLNQLRDSTPRVEGTLRKAMHAYRTNTHFVIAFYDSGYYWFMVDGLPEKYKRIAQREIPRMQRIAFKVALDRVLRNS